jgi:hypothetical protein
VSYSSKAGRARISAKNPQAFGVCDRCGIWENLVSLQNQFDWRGTSLQNLWLRVCKRCLDTPQQQLRSITLPADPVPVDYPRPENFEAAETNYRTTVPGSVDPVTGLPIPSQLQRVTEDGQTVVEQPYGIPTGLDQNAVMPYNGVIQKALGTPLPVLSVISNGTATIFVTCSQPHGLNNNDQIAVQGLSNPKACGFFSVTMFTATVFTYATANNIVAASLLTPTTRMVTALVGLPRGFDAIAQVQT